MSFPSIGDLTQVFQSRRQQASLKLRLERLSQEMASGEKQDLARAVSGDFGNLASIERAFAANQAYRVSIAEAAGLASAVQSALETADTQASELAPALLTASTSEHAMLLSSTSHDAKYRLGSVIAALNVRVADRYALSGTATGNPPLIDADTLVAAVSAAIGPQTTAAGIVSAIDVWFDTPGGGFDTTAYMGGPSRAPLQLSDDTRVDLPTTAADERIRPVIKGLVMAALVDSPGFSAPPEERAKLAKQAGVTLAGASSGLANVQALVGSAQAVIDSEQTRNTAAQSALGIAKSELVSVDPYDTATAIQEATNRLEALYSVTARLSHLSLTDFLR